MPTHDPARPSSRAEPSRAEPSLRAWLEHVAQTAIDWLDVLDAADEDREDDEREVTAWE